MSKFLRIRVQIDESCNCTYYSGIPVKPGDKIAISTRFGITTGTVTSITDEVNEDPFKRGTAKQHVLENMTQKIYDKENHYMFGAKTVEVKHISSNRKGIFYTDIDLTVGQTVVYEGMVQGKPGIPYVDDTKRDFDDQAAGLHVGVVTNTDPDTITATNWVVCAVDVSAHQERLKRVKEAKKLRAKLDAKRSMFQDIEILNLIAQNDPETKQMLDDYKNLVGGGINGKV